MVFQTLVHQMQDTKLKKNMTNEQINITRHYSLEFDKLEQLQLKEHQLMSRRHLEDLKALEGKLLIALES